MRRKNLTRREFMERTSVGLGAAGFVPWGAKGKGPGSETAAGGKGSSLASAFHTPKSSRPLPGQAWNLRGGASEFAEGLAGFERPWIFPTPRQMALGGAPFALHEDCIIAIPHGTSSSDESLARFLTEELSDRYDLQLHTQRLEKLPAAGRVIVIGSTENPLVRELCQKHHLDVTPQSPGPEGYVLKTDENAVVVAGSDARGVFYGLQSLRQLIFSSEGGLQVPGVEVRDWPDKRFRGVKLYVPGRGSIPFFRRFIREVMALYKFNTLMMEMNACMRLDRHPEVNAGWIEFARDTNYSRVNYPPGPLHGREQNSSHHDCGDGSILEKDEVVDMVRWVREHHIEVVPEIPSFTHSFYLLARHKDLSDVPGDKWPDTFCPSEPRSYQLAFEVMDEYIEVMKPRMIHAGHDEWFAPFGVCPRCQGKDPGELFGQDLRKTHAHLANQNIKMAIWGDYLLEAVRGKGLQKRTAPDGWAYTSPGAMTPEQVKKLVPKDILLFNWFWGEEDHGAANEVQLDEWGFEQVYGNMEPDLLNYAERSRRKTILGGAPSSWAATNEFNISKDMLFSILGCSNMLWSGQAPEFREVAKITQASIPRLRPRLAGVSLPSEAGDGVAPVDISAALNLPAAGTSLEVDLRGMITGRIQSGPRAFELTRTDSADGKVAVGVGTEGQKPSPLPREAVVAVGQDATSLLFLHACARPATNKEAYRLLWDVQDSADLLGWYEIVYEDGLPEVIPIRYGVNILEWNWGQEKTSGKYCYNAEAVACGKSGEQPITFFAFEWESPRLGKVIREVRLKGSTGFRGGDPGFENHYGEVIPNNAVILKALSVVKKRG
ncbi:MAG: beta-N-acetylhexosaminidase [Terriglobia bacterium]